jgi:hypothetical protein
MDIKGLQKLLAQLTLPRLRLMVGQDSRVETAHTTVPVPFSPVISSQVYGPDIKRDEAFDIEHARNRTDRIVAWCYR